MEFKALVARINELAHKKKTTGLSEEELKEQKALYVEYLAGIRSQLKAQLDAIEIVEEDIQKEEKLIKEEEKLIEQEEKVLETEENILN